MIVINDQLSVPDDELSFTASRSGGPGGQNVNKVSSRVTLTFDVVHSPSLSPAQKHRISGKLATRINKEGVLRVISQRTRSQELNKDDTVARFIELLGGALTVEPPRFKTRPTAGARERRLDDKKKRTVIKRERTKKEWD
jgi:ribosome-associated protein